MRAIKLPKKCDRAAAESLHPDILEAFGDISIAVDAGEVERNTPDRMLRCILQHGRIGAS